MNKYERYRLHDCERDLDKLIQYHWTVDSPASLISQIRETVRLVRDAEYERYISYKTPSISERYYSTYKKLSDIYNKILYINTLHTLDLRNAKQMITDVLEYDKSFGKYSQRASGVRSWEHEDFSDW